MPRLDDYACVACERTFEYLIHGADDQPGCPYCGSSNVTRQIGKPGLELINYHNSDFNERQTARIDARAEEHNKRKDTQEMIAHKKAQILGGASKKLFGS